jgi:hypothetical protein
MFVSADRSAKRDETNLSFRAPRNEQESCSPGFVSFRSLPCPCPKVDTSNHIPYGRGRRSRGAAPVRGDGAWLWANKHEHWCDLRYAKWFTCFRTARLGHVAYLSKRTRNGEVKAESTKQVYSGPTTAPETITKQTSKRPRNGRFERPY